MLFVAIVCLNDQDDTFFKLRDVLRIIPVKSVQIVPHLVVSFWTIVNKVDRKIKKAIQIGQEPKGY